MPPDLPCSGSGLWQSVLERGERAHNRGTLRSITTDSEVVRDRGVSFLIHILANMQGKARAREAQRIVGFNPFLPPDPDLLVAAISPTHNCVLNKFNVLPNHLLIVTRAFEAQERLLTAADMAALAICLAEIDGLAFYNGGQVGGASQPHKHLQLVVGNLGPPPPVPAIPIEEALIASGFSSAFPFAHAVVRLDLDPALPTSAAAELLSAAYHDLLAATDVATAGSETQQRPYNLLVTRRWMMVVGRRLETWQGISVNSLGFAGSLLVRNRQQLALVKKHGPMNVLRNVATGNETDGTGESS